MGSVPKQLLWDFKNDQRLALNDSSKHDADLRDSTGNGIQSGIDESRIHRIRRP